MPPPSLSMTTMRTGVETSRRAARPPRSWSRPRSPVTIVVGRPLAWAAPIPEEMQAVDPVGAAVAEEEDVGVAGGQERLLVADRHARGGVDEVAVAVGGAERAVQGGLGDRPLPPTRLVARAPPGAAASAAIHARGAPRGSSLQPRRPAGGQLGRVGAQDRRGAVARLVPAAAGVDDDFARRRSPPARPAAACWSASRRSGGRSRGRPSGRSARRAAAGRRRRSTWERSWGPQRSCEVGSARIGKPETRARWASGSRSSGSSWRPATITPAIASPMWPATSSSRKAEGSRSIRRHRGQRPPVAALQRQRVGRGHRALDRDRRQRLAPGQVEVDRARARISPRAAASARQATER